MALKEIDTQAKRLDALFEKARQLPEDPEVLSHWARYLCVLTCGFLENSVESCLMEYCKKRSSLEVQNFVRRQLYHFQNPKMDEIIACFGSFSQEWKVALESECKDELRDSVNSIVGNRHRIAHGESVSLTISGLQNYYQGALKVVAILQRICGI